MRKLSSGLAAFGLTIALASVQPALAESGAPSAGGGQQTGTVVAVEEEVVRVKGADGKEYEVDAMIVAAEDLKTGDIVEYGVVNEKPVRVKKKK
jgi:hypothetical protein